MERALENCYFGGYYFSRLGFQPRFIRDAILLVGDGVDHRRQGRVGLGVVLPHVSGSLVYLFRNDIRHELPVVRTALRQAQGLASIFRGCCVGCQLCVVVHEHLQSGEIGL